MLVLTLIAAALQQTPKPAESVAHYRFDTIREQTVDFSSLPDSIRTKVSLQPPERESFLFTATFRDSAGGVVAHVEIDSIGNRANTSLLTQLAKMSDSVRKAVIERMGGNPVKGMGDYIEVFFNGSKRIETGESSTSPQTRPIFTKVLPLMFPTVGPTGSRVATWTDTTSWDIGTPGPPIPGQSTHSILVSWRASATNTYDGDITARSSFEVNEDIHGAGINAATKGRSRTVFDKNRIVSETGASYHTELEMNLPGEKSPMKTTFSITMTLKRVS